MIYPKILFNVNNYYFIFNIVLNILFFNEYINKYKLINRN
jgi:hypothetical protein